MFLLFQMLLSNKIGDEDVGCLHSMNSCLRELLSVWFSVGFMQLERITWESPCDMLQKVTAIHCYNSQYPGYTWQHFDLVDADLSCHMVLGSTCRFLPHTVNTFHSSLHTNNMAGNHSDEISINEIVSIKEDLGLQRDGYLIILSGMQNWWSLLIKLCTG